MKRHYVLLYFFLLALLAMTGMFLGCSSSQAFAASSSGLAGVESGGEAMYVASGEHYVVPATTYTKPFKSNNPKDIMWQQYVGRTPAFANCSPCAETPAYKSSGKKLSKKSKKATRRTASKKKSGRSTKTVKRSTALPPVQADLFPDAICPPGCVPEARAGRGAPRISSLRESSGKSTSKAKAAPQRAVEAKELAAPPVMGEPAANGKQSNTSSANGAAANKENFALRVISNDPKPVATVVPSASMVPSAVTAGSAEVSSSGTPNAQP